MTVTRGRVSDLIKADKADLSGSHCREHRHRGEPNLQVTTRVGVGSGDEEFRVQFGYDRVVGQPISQVSLDQHSVFLCYSQQGEIGWIQGKSRGETSKPQPRVHPHECFARK